MRLEHLFIGLAVFFLVITTGYNLIVNQAVNYGVDTDTAKLLALTAENDLDDLSGNLRNKTTNEEISDDTEAELYRTSRGASLEIKNLESSSRAVLETLNLQESGLIDKNLIDTAIIVIGVLISTFLLYLGWRFKPQND